VIELPAWLRRKKAEKNTVNYKVNVTPPADLKTEVDRILDKINSSGFSALTDDEKRVLDEAKDLLSRH
jgi:predicted RNA-binding protein with PUA domain